MHTHLSTIPPLPPLTPHQHPPHTHPSTLPNPPHQVTFRVFPQKLVRLGLTIMDTKEMVKKLRSDILVGERTAFILVQPELSFIETREPTPEGAKPSSDFVGGGGGRGDMGACMYWQWFIHTSMSLLLSLLFLLGKGGLT